MSFKYIYQHRDDKTIASAWEATIKHIVEYTHSIH